MVNCRKCEFFYVTWENATPYGCKLHGFKSPEYPYIAVRKASGEDCRGFKEKASESSEE